jgi:CDP-6-deoxy-D-xylo-4-hexulose-3-dehydrase
MTDRLNSIRDLVAAYGPSDPLGAVPADQLPLAVPSFGPEEVEAAIDTLLKGWITMGPQVFQFEKLWAKEVGVAHAVAVNSGSSALLVMLTALVQGGYLEKGTEVIVPAVGWSTSLFSVLNAGLKAVVVDVDPETLSLKGRFEQPVLAIHMLGAPSDVRSPLLMEDACGAHGAMLNGKKVGGIGKCGAFSFFFSHHLSTGEGGMITTNDPKLADICRGIRAHGWSRDRTDHTDLARRYPDIDPRFLFVQSGYNLRMTEVSGAFGVHQVPRLSGFVERRRRNHIHWCELISELNLPLRVFPEQKDAYHAGFAFPILLDEGAPISRHDLCAALERKNIQTRPVSGSNLTRQPVFEDLQGVRVEGPLTVADAVHERGFFVGQSHAFDERHGSYLAQSLKEIFKLT